MEEAGVYTGKWDFVTFCGSGSYIVAGLPGGLAGQ